eukprot:NODE_124_length_17341_cov_0.560028.p1 type:complete len:952 gc:universal NODE_124_length_17341_cov_0.560028:6293-9148(+)
MNKKVVALENFVSSDNLAQFAKNSIIQVIQEDPSGYYYYGFNTEKKGGWFVKTAVADYVEPPVVPVVEPPKLAPVSSGFMTPEQMEALGMQKPKKVAPIAPVIDNAQPELRKAPAPSIPVENNEQTMRRKAAPPPPQSTFTQDVMSSGIAWNDMDKINALMNQSNSGSQSKQTSLGEGESNYSTAGRKKIAPTPPTTDSPSSTLQRSESNQNNSPPESMQSLGRKKAPPLPTSSDEFITNKKSAPTIPESEPVNYSSINRKKAPAPPPESVQIDNGNTAKTRKASAPPPPQLQANWMNVDSLNSMMSPISPVPRTTDTDFINSKRTSALDQSVLGNNYAQPVSNDYTSNPRPDRKTSVTANVERERSESISMTNSRRSTVGQGNMFSDANSPDMNKSTGNRSRSDSSSKVSRGRAASNGKAILQQMDVNDLASANTSLTVKNDQMKSMDELLGPSVKNTATLFGESKSANQKSPLDDYAARNFGADDKGFTWQKIPIKKPMHKISDTNARKLVLNCFECILSYCGDASGNRFDAARTVVDISKSPLASDEVVCQLLKQTINNTSSVAESSIRVWALLCLVLVYAEPSLALKQALIEHLKIVAKYDKPFDQLAKKCMENLHLAGVEQRRKMLPSNIEILAFELTKYCIPLKLEYPNGVSKSYNVSPFTKGSDVLTQAVKYLSLPDFLDHGIAISIDELEVLPILPDEKVLDVIAIVEKLIVDKDDKKVEASLETLEKAKFSLIRKVWMKVDPLLFNEMDEWELTQIYNEIRPNFISGNWLGQLQLQKDYLDVMSNLAATRSLVEGKGDLNYNAYFPKVYLDLHDKKEKKKENSAVQVAFANAVEQSRYAKSLQLKREFIKVVHEWDLFGSRVFQVVFDSDNRLAGDAFCAIRPDDVWFLDSSRKPISTIKYPDIQKLTLEQGGREVLIKSGTVAQQRVIRFQSRQGFAIQTA